MRTAEIERKFEKGMVSNIACSIANEKENEFLSEWVNG